LQIVGLEEDKDKTKPAKAQFVRVNSSANVESE
jgi:hypothetical protein